MTHSGDISLNRPYFAELFQTYLSLFHFVFLCSTFSSYAFYFCALLKSQLQFNTSDILYKEGLQ